MDTERCIERCGHLLVWDWLWREVWSSAGMVLVMERSVVICWHGIGYREKCGHLLAWNWLWREVLSFAGMGLVSEIFMVI